MEVLNLKIDGQSQTELTTILNKLDIIVCEIMNDEDNQDNWQALKCSREALNKINKARTADCGYTMYINCVGAQHWTKEAYLEVTTDRSI